MWGPHRGSLSWAGAWHRTQRGPPSWKPPSSAQPGTGLSPPSPCQLPPEPGLSPPPCRKPGTSLSIRGQGVGTVATTPLSPTGQPGLAHSASGAHLEQACGHQPPPGISPRDNTAAAAASGSQEQPPPNLPARISFWLQPQSRPELDCTLPLPPPWTPRDPYSTSSPWAGATKRGNLISLSSSAVALQVGDRASYSSALTPPQNTQCRPCLEPLSLT